MKTDVEKSQRLINLWDKNKPNRSNSHVIRVPEGKKKEEGTEKVVKEIMSKNFPDLAKDKQKYSSCWEKPNRINPKK